MLLGIKVRHFTVIEELELSFGPGLCVVTGETGAGKSLLVDCLALLLGARADAAAIRQGCDEAIVEGVFEASKSLVCRLTAAGLPELGDEVSVRRVVSRNGRGRVYVNGSLASAGLLAHLVRGECQISGQREHVGLADQASYLPLLDRYGGLQETVAGFRASYEEAGELARALAAESERTSKVASRRADLCDWLGEIERLAPVGSEDVVLAEERKRRLGAQKLRALVAEAVRALGSDEGSVQAGLGTAVRHLVDASRIDATLGPRAEALSALAGEIGQILRPLEHLLEDFADDPQRLRWVEERLEVLSRVKRRHAASIEEILTRQTAWRAELSELERDHANGDRLVSQLSEARARAEAAASRLSRERARAARRLSAQTQRLLRGLAMPGARFEVRLAKAESMHAGGLDQALFLFSANEGEAVRPVCEVASGGELSRLFLALQWAAPSGQGAGTIVLDEVDAGVGGAVAEVVGRAIHEVARERQVLCITHLPQVAAFADTHLCVRKEASSGRTFVSVERLQGKRERDLELARMLSGLEVTPQALGAARALVKATRIQRSC